MKSRSSLVLALACALPLGALGGCASPRIVLVRGGGGARDAFEARGLDGGFLASPEARACDWGEVFQVFIDPRDPGDARLDGEAPAARQGLPPLLGSASQGGQAIRFEPRFPLEPGHRYRARLQPGPWLGPLARDGTGLEEVFELPAKPLVPRGVVAHIFPSASLLPENQLKFYIHFSHPMRRGQAYDRIHLLDVTTSREVEAPFLELGEELWDPERRRFTLFFDPGRVKRGLRPHDELGPPLVAGRNYALVIDGGWLDAEGAPLKEGCRKDFRVGEPDYEPLDPGGWRLTPPAARGREPLLVTFPEPLDHALLHRLLVVHFGGQEIPGEVKITGGEREWRFEPESAWEAGRHELVVDTVLEDLAGNAIGRPFEVDVERSLEARILRKTVTLPFEVAGQR